MTEKEEYLYYSIAESGLKIKLCVSDPSGFSSSSFHTLFDSTEIAELITQNNDANFDYEFFLNDMLSELKFVSLKLEVSRYSRDYENNTTSAWINNGPELHFENNQEHGGFYVTPSVAINARHSVHAAKHQHTILYKTPAKNIIDELYKIIYDKDKIFELVSISDIYKNEYARTTQYEKMSCLIDDGTLVLEPNSTSSYSITGTNWYVYFAKSYANNTNMVRFSKGADTHQYSYDDLLSNKLKPKQKQKLIQFEHMLELFSFLRRKK